MWKNLSIIAVCILIGVAVGWGLTLYQLNVRSVENKALNSKVEQLEAKIGEQVDIIADLDTKAYLRSFSSEKELSRWLATTNSKKSNTDYYSEAAVELVREARDAGYFMGLTAVEFMYDRYGKPDYLRVPVGGGGVVICTTVIGGDAVYLVDPCNYTLIKTTTMVGELNLHMIDTDKKLW